MARRSARPAIEADATAQEVGGAYSCRSPDTLPQYLAAGASFFSTRKGPGRMLEHGDRFAAAASAAGFELALSLTRPRRRAPDPR